MLCLLRILCVIFTGMNYVSINIYIFFAHKNIFIYFIKKSIKILQRDRCGFCMLLIGEGKSEIILD